MKPGRRFSAEAPVVVIGAGPAGLTAAYELARQGETVVVFEQDDQPGGLARTVEYKGYRFDIGGHRFFTKIEIVNALWRTLLGDDLLLRSRLSRILYNGRYFAYPLKPMNALRNLGLLTSAQVLLSYFRSKLVPRRPEISFADWVSNRFGRRLYTLFFKTYTEKVWGIPCERISAQWAAQRIRGLSLRTALLSMFVPGYYRSGKRTIKTLIDVFHYPRLGPGMMWKALCERIEHAGGEVKLNHRITRVLHSSGRITGVEVEQPDGRFIQPASLVISSMPLRPFVHALSPDAPQEVLAMVDRLSYRDFITVALIIDERDIFPDNWLYIHNESVRVGRIQNYKNWSPEMVPDAAKTCLGLEYFCSEGDELWTMDDRDLVSFAKKELAAIELVSEDKVVDGTVVRMPKAYPIYDEGFQEALERVRAHLDRFENLQEIGRNGLHKYNNMDHSMLTALLAVRNIYGEDHDLWAINVDDEYQEEGQSADIESGVGV